MQPQNVKIRVVRDVIFIYCVYEVNSKACECGIYTYAKSAHGTKSIKFKYEIYRRTVQCWGEFQCGAGLPCVSHVHCAVVANERHLHLFLWAIDKPLLVRIFCWGILWLLMGRFAGISMNKLIARLSGNDFWLDLTQV